MNLKSLARFVLFAAASTVAATTLAASPGLEVGSAAPPLDLASADGSNRSLAEIDGPRVLIFYRGLW